MKLIDRYWNEEAWGWGPSFNVYQLDSEDEEINLEELDAEYVGRDVTDPLKIIVCYR